LFEVVLIASMRVKSAAMLTPALLRFWHDRSASPGPVNGTCSSTIPSAWNPPLSRGAMAAIQSALSV
jgi:hypothetical protein